MSGEEKHSRLNYCNVVRIDHTEPYIKCLITQSFVYRTVCTYGASTQRKIIGQWTFVFTEELDQVCFESCIVIVPF